MYFQKCSQMVTMEIECHRHKSGETRAGCNKGRVSQGSTEAGNKQGVKDQAHGRSRRSLSTPCREHYRAGRAAQDPGNCMCVSPLPMLSLVPILEVNILDRDKISRTSLRSGSGAAPLFPSTPNLRTWQRQQMGCASFGGAGRQQGGAGRVSQEVCWSAASYKKNAVQESKKRHFFSRNTHSVYKFAFENNFYNSKCQGK